MRHGYRNNSLAQLSAQQVKYATAAKRVEQAARAEEFLREIDPDKTYPYELACFRITGFRPASDPKNVMSGGDLQHDLPLFIENVFGSVKMPVEQAGEPVFTVDTLARKHRVATKTISRWREAGLVSRPFVFDGRLRIGFLDGSVQHFVKANPDRVKRGERFSQLSAEERDNIIDLARRLARGGARMSEVFLTIAKQTGRSVEAVRYNVKNFDKVHPEYAVFPQASGALSKESKAQLYRDHCVKKVPIEQLEKIYKKKRSTIYRAISDIRREQVLATPFCFTDSPEFALVGKRGGPRECDVVGPTPTAEAPTRKARPPADMPPYLAAMYETPLLSAEQERHLFRKFNYLKFKAKTLCDGLGKGRVKSSVLDEIEALGAEAVAVKNEILKANLRLVVAIAKRHVTASDDFFTLVSDGNMSLMRAIDKFDYTRGNKFSTYATWAIMKNFARTIPEEFRYRDRYHTGLEELFTAREDTRTDQHELENAQLQREGVVREMLHSLEDREREIIELRFGLGADKEGKTLKEVGMILGVTKERVRQIEARALQKLKNAADGEAVEFLEL